jgi:hypothetical protein
MRKRTLGAVLLAGLALSGAGAFTAGNTFSNTTDVAGYGENTVTGATVTAISYTSSTTDSSKLAAVVFTTSTDMASKTAELMLRPVTGTTPVGGPYTCGTAVDAVTGIAPTISTTSWRFTCSTSDNPNIASIGGVGLTVHQ